MVTTVTLNPCIDYTVTVPGLLPGELNLVDTARTDMAGKGVNVAVVLEELGIPTLCTGISFEGNHAVLASYLDGLNIAHDFVLAPGHIRTNVKIVDTTTNSMTEINSRGDRVSAGILPQVAERIAGHAARSELIVVSGRIPNGAGDDTYRRLIAKLRRTGCKVALDCDGAPLADALRERPYLIKPNLYELEHTFHRKATTLPEILSVCGWILSCGVEVVCVSMGARGALLASKAGAWYAEGLPVEAKGFQGAGDSMVAGMCKAVVEGAGFPEMLRYGIAASAASVMREGTQLCRRGDFQRLLPDVKITTLQ